MAIDYENQLKKWSKEKKKALINSDFELLSDLAKKKFDWHLDTNFWKNKNSLDVTIPNDPSSSDFERIIDTNFYKNKNSLDVTKIRNVSSRYIKLNQFEVCSFIYNVK